MPRASAENVNAARNTNPKVAVTTANCGVRAVQNCFCRGVIWETNSAVLGGIEAPRITLVRASGWRGSSDDSTFDCLVGHAA